MTDPELTPAIGDVLKAARERLLNIARCGQHNDLSNDIGTVVDALDGVPERYAKLVEEMLGHREFVKHPDARMALAIAAKAIRRGRHLTEDEKWENLCKATEETDPAFADRLRQKLGLQEQQP